LALSAVITSFGRSLPYDGVPFVTWSTSTPSLPWNPICLMTISVSGFFGLSTSSIATPRYPRTMRPFSLSVA
jgi:hypothetical protein